jgi:hypothetical protein
MKATLEFDLPDEKQLHLESLHGPVAFSSMLVIRNLILNWRKYGEHASLDSLIKDIEEEIAEASIKTGVEI